MRKLLILLPILFLSGCYDARYDQCEREYPLTHDYRQCVKRFQDDDAAIAAVSAATTAASVVSISQ